MQEEGSTIFEEWLAEVNKVSSTEKIPSIIKRCPKCKQLGIEFDPDTKRVHCTKCGFEQFLKG